MKQANIGDILSEKEYKTCVELIKTCSSYDKCKQIARLVIGPKIEEINQKLGQRNDPLYLAYAIVYAIEVKDNQETFK